MILKNKLLGLTFLFLVSCSSKTKKEMFLDINQNIANRVLNGADKGLIFSCIRCNCFIGSMNEAFKNDSTFLRSIYMLTDTSCAKLKFKMNYISRIEIDNISEELYNVILFKKENEKYISRIVETEESPQILKIMKDFFKQ